MATIRQLNANRQNAQSSTGPTSDEGKASSRGNAVQHGLAGAGIVLSDCDMQAVAERLDAWRSDYPTLNAHQEWLYERMVVATVRIDRCASEQFRVQSYQAERARVCWDADRQLDADEIGAGLSRRPTLVVQRLGRTRQGCEWMIRRWQELDLVRHVNLEWDEAQTSTAYDLLGYDRVLRDGLGFPANQSLEHLVQNELVRLQQRIESGLADLDVCEREHAAAGDPLTPMRDVLRLRRYEADCMRQYYKARSELLDSLSKTSAEAAPKAPAARPEPATISAQSPDAMRLMGHALTDLVPPAVEPEAAKPVVPAGKLEPSVGTPSHRLNRRQRRAAEKRAHSR